MSVFVQLLFDAEWKLEWSVKVRHQGWYLMSIRETELPLSKAGFNWKWRHLELASEVVSTRPTGSWKPAALLHHKTNHPAADAVVIIQAHSCRQYLLLQPEMQSKDGRMLGGEKRKLVQTKHKEKTAVGGMKGVVYNYIEERRKEKAQEGIKQS